VRGPKRFVVITRTAGVVLIGSARAARRSALGKLTSGYGPAIRRARSFAVFRQDSWL
jgi:hypothetical protein